MVRRSPLWYDYRPTSLREDYSDALFFAVSTSGRYLCRHYTGGWLHCAGIEPIQPYYGLARRASIIDSAGYFERCGAGAVISYSAALFATTRYTDKPRAS